MVVEALAPSHLNQGSSCNLGTTATDAQGRKIVKYCKFIDIGQIFQLLALEVKSSLGKNSEVFVTRFCKIPCRSDDDQRGGSFLKQSALKGTSDLWLGF